MTISPQAADALRGKAGFQVIGDHVRISQELVRECVDRQQPNRQIPSDQNGSWNFLAPTRSIIMIFARCHCGLWT